MGKVSGVFLREEFGRFRGSFAVVHSEGKIRKLVKKYNGEDEITSYPTTAVIGKYRKHF